MRGETPESPPEQGISPLSAREVLAANLQVLMLWKPQYGSTLSIERRTGELGCKIGKSTVDRVLKCQAPFNLDFLDVLAQVFGMDAWQLLVPDMNPKNAPVLRSVGAAEEELYAKMRAIAKQVGDLGGAPAPSPANKPEIT